MKEELTNLRSDLKEKDVYLKKYIENIVIERVHRVKRNSDNNKNNDQTRKPRTVVVKLLHFKDKQDILHGAKSRKIRNFYFKEDFSGETLAIRKGL